MPKPLQFFVIALVFFVHLWLVLVAISWVGAIDLHSSLMLSKLPFAHGLVMTQCSLLTLLALLVRMPSYLRLLGLFAGWLIPCGSFCLITDRMITHDSVVMVGIVITIQSGSLLLLVSGLRLTPARFRKFLFGKLQSGPRRFRINELFLWTAAVAIVFGAGRFLVVEFEWNIDRDRLKWLLPFYLHFALTTPLIVISVVATYWPRDWRARMYIGGISAAITIACCIFSTASITWLYSTLEEDLITAWTSVTCLVQFILLHVTLAALTMCGLWRGVGELWPKRSERELLPPSFFDDEEE